MKKATIILGTFVLLLLSSCTSNDGVKVKSSAENTDMSKVKTDIQSVENDWAAALNKRDLDALMNLYTEDAQTLQDGGATLKGRSAIRAQHEKDWATPPRYASIAFETQDVYGTPEEVTEVGTSTEKDSTGNVTGTGKYMAIFQKKDGKYKCVREIYNRDTK